MNRFWDRWAADQRRNKRRLTRLFGVWWLGRSDRLASMDKWTSTLLGTLLLTGLPGLASGQVKPVAAVTAAAPVATASVALSPEQLLGLVRQSVAAAAEQAQAQWAATLPGVRVETEVGAFDPSLRLAPCQMAEPHLPPNTRVWGTMRIGLRCVQGPVAWNVFVPARVRVLAPVLVAAGALPPGHVLAESDLVLQEAELTAEPGATLQDAGALVGRALAHGLRAGQALRAQHVRPRLWFAAGESVTLVARGAGFAISSSGTALGAGLEGQAVRVRVENGRVVSGVPTGQRRVEIAL